MKVLTIYIRNRMPIKLSCPDDIILDINFVAHEHSKQWKISQREPPTDVAIINEDYFEGIVFGGTASSVKELKEL
jgi:hypothetical protein